MLLFQSSNTVHKYFPELNVGEYDPMLAERTQITQYLFYQPILISRLATKILEFTQFKGTDASYSKHILRVQINNGKVKKTKSMGFAYIASLCLLGEDGGKEEDGSYEQELASEKGGAKGRNSWTEMPKFLLAGAVSTVISRTCVAPLERIKLESIVQGSRNTWLNIIQSIWVSEGLIGFWKGNALNLFRMVPFKSINFICYDMYLDHRLSIPGKKEIMNHDRLIGGGISGIIATMLCFPLDTIRTRLSAPGGEALGGVVGCVFHMVQNEGLLSLYKGLAPAIISMGPASAVFYGVYDMLKSSYLSKKKSGSEDGNELGVVRTLIYGAVAGACAETATYPLEVIRRQLQLQRSTNLGLASAFINLIEREGVGSLFAGILPSTLQVLPSAALSYSFYELMKSLLKIS